jgi:hypothetical protein
MKKVVFPLLAFSIVFLTKVFAADHHDDPFLLKKFPVSSITKADVKTSGGSIQVLGDATSEAVVEVYVYPNNKSQSRYSNEKIQSILDEYYDLEINVENGTLHATAKRKNGLSGNSNTNLSISFVIHAGNKTDTDLKTSGGSIQISHLSGEQNLKTSGGSIKVEKAAGNIKGKTSGGSIQVVDSRENIELTTSGGSIQAEDCSGTITLRTSGGSIRLSDLEGTITAATSGGSVKVSDVKGTLHASTSGGSMNFSDIEGNLEAATSGGNIWASIKSVDKYIRLKNSGDIKVTVPAGGYNLDLKGRNVSTGVLSDFKGNFDTKHIAGTTGNGGPELTVKSSRQVTVSFK